MNKIEKRLRGMWGTINCITVYIVRVPEEKGRKKKWKCIRGDNGWKHLKFIEKEWLTYTSKEPKELQVGSM